VVEREQLVVGKAKQLVERGVVPRQWWYSPQQREVSMLGQERHNLERLDQRWRRVESKRCWFFGKAPCMEILAKQG